MRRSDTKSPLKLAVLAVNILLLGATAAFAQQQINLTAGPTNLILPDGSSVPMWGYSCGAVVAGSTATCAALNANAGGRWSPVVITVPTGQTLTINLTNNLSFTPAGTTTANNVPTSIVVVGQIGGGLGSSPTYTASPTHNPQDVTWPIANTGTVNNPPTQGPRVQSFSTEVAAGTTTSLTWQTPRPGTYLLESGTHPSIQVPMGLIGMLVVTQAPSAGAAGVAYQAVNYDADVPLEFSEIDPVQNNAVSTAVNSAGFSETAVWTRRANGGISAITVTYGGSGYSATNPPNVTISGGGGYGGAATATVDPTTGTVTSITVSTGGAGVYQTPPTITIDPSPNGAAATATASATLSPITGGPCGGAGACYPPAVNYSPLYFLINGVAFNKTNAAASSFAANFATPPATGTPSGQVLLRLVNAGSKMHVPSIVGSTTTGFDGKGVRTTVAGFSLIAEDGNVAPGVPKVQTDVFMAAGKTFDVMINGPGAGAAALPVYDRELSLSGNSSERDAGMVAYVSVNGGALPSAPAFAAAVAAGDNYSVVCPTAGSCNTLVVSDVAKGVLANDVNVYGVQVVTQPAKGALSCGVAQHFPINSSTICTNGTFSYVPNAGWASPDSFTYCGNGTTAGAACATVTLSAGAVEPGTGIVMGNIAYTSNIATFLKIPPPGVLSADSDNAGYPLTVDLTTVSAVSGAGTIGTVSMDANGGFVASGFGPGQYTFTYKAKNSQGTQSASSAQVTLNFPQPSNLAVNVIDGQTKASLTDYRWIIEEDRTFFNDPKCTTNTHNPPPGCPVTSNGTELTFGVNFHTSAMPFVAQGCTGPLSCESGQTVLDPTSGQHVPAVCDVGNGVCRPDPTGNGQTPINPSQVSLDPTKRYYISVLPGDAQMPFEGAGGGHGMSGAPIAAGQTAVTILTTATPYPTGRLSVMVFEDDDPLNGEQDTGGGVDVLAPNEPGLGGFNILILDAAGAFGDATGQMTYDMFNMPLSNGLAGTIDPATGLDACPISTQDTADPTQKGITGMIVTCPKYESDGKTLSALAGQAVIPNLMPGQFTVMAVPGADRIARGEEWLQTNTLDGQHPHDAFVRIGEPAYFQEYGPAGFHVAIGFANPAIINARKPSVCASTIAGGGSCSNSITGRVTTVRLSRAPDERLYSSGSRDSFAFTQCYLSLGDPDGADFAFTKCDADGNFTFTGIPDGHWRISIFDQWDDELQDGLSVPVAVAGGTTVNMGDVPMQQWQINMYTRTYVDDNKDGLYDGNEIGIPFLGVNVRTRDGSSFNRLLSDFDGVANFNETFPLFNWYVVETDPTRYKTTGIHVVYDAGGPADGGPLTSIQGAPSTCSPTTNPPCGPSTNTISKFLANTYEPNPLPSDLSVPGAVYCSDADCSTRVGVPYDPTLPVPSSTTNHSTGRIDPPWVISEGWQGFIGQNNFIEFGKAPYAPGENGGIQGHVVYASTRPFDDASLNVQNVWERLVPHVTVNLYKEGTAADGTQSLTLVDTTQTSSWDDWAQGFRSDGKPNLNCPGQSTNDLFFFTLDGQPNYLNYYDSQHGGPAAPALPYNSQYKCYDGMHNWNQVQPAPYDGMYAFPSVTGLDPTTGKPTGTNCKICIADPSSSNPADETYDPYRAGIPMLPAGKYVVEVVLPPGYELVKEEDKNILIGDNFIAPVTQEFGGLANVFIIPDQASVAAAYDESGAGPNPNNAQDPTLALGASQNTQIVPAFPVEPVWPCVGAQRIVPDYMSIFPQSFEVAPFAGATRPLCDRKEVTLTDQRTSIAKFYIYTSTHIASHYTGIITDDFTSEFDPFSPTFGEKFSPPNLPVSMRDWTGAEISRVYTDSWGVFNGLNYSTWEVNPPNPTGYSPTMMIGCMNDPGPIPDPNHPGQMITDPLFNPVYSQFCYELAFMPGLTDYMDTPVIPTAGFVGAGYNNPDCSYPDSTPAISTVTGDVAGPWVSAPNHTLTINALPDQQVNNYGYSGPSATAAPFNAKTVNRHYGFGAAQGTVTIGGVAVPAANITTWSDTQIVLSVPANVPACAIQQQAQYGGPNGTTVPAEQCGELVITTASGKQSVDTITVTIGGKTPTVLASGQTLQSAIDAAAPGDLIIVPPGTYNEFLLMWKPVRLQGAGAATTILNANTQPAGKLDPWRRQVNCLFGLAINGQPYTGNGAAGGTNPYDPTYDPSQGTGYSCPGQGWKYFSGAPNLPQVDRITWEGILGWDVTVNGNLAELLQEPTLMGAYEGAGITILGKGVSVPAGQSPFGIGSEAAYPTGTTLLSAADCTSGTNGANPYPSNFYCNPSRIDGLAITDSSQGGGGIFAHGWAQNLEISNNRVYNNSGTLSGGINIGQGEFPDAILVGSDVVVPGSCQTSNITNQQLPYCFNTNVNVHNNSVTLNSSIGDEVFSGTPAGAGGVSFMTGSDFYKFSNNWVCGNLSSGDGGGLGQLGYSWHGDIEHNTIIFNQSTNPTIPTNGGGIVIMGAAPDAPGPAGSGLTECGSTTDVDCQPGLSDGTGPGLVINANLIEGNGAESGSGGGIRLQVVNGTEVGNFPNNPERWNSVSVTNNIINNNVAGWDGGGISLQDALKVDIVNNTIMSNDATASSGVLFNPLGAPNGATPPPGCDPATLVGCNNPVVTSTPQAAGLVTMPNTPNLTGSFPAQITCPAGYSSGSGQTSPTVNGDCRKISYPRIYNDVFWQNRTFNITVGGYNNAYQQNEVSLIPVLNQPATPSTAPNGAGVVITGGTGACVNGANYWDIGVRGDTGPANHSGGAALSPTYSVVTDVGDYPGLHNLGTNPQVQSQYCNGSRVPPENGGLGYQVPPGVADATVPNPVFNLTPNATVDEGNNWINISWGPLSLTNPTVTGTDGNYSGGAFLGRYLPTGTSPTIDVVPPSASTYSFAPHTDFFGNPRPDINRTAIDIGAVEFQTRNMAFVSIAPSSLAFGNEIVFTVSATQTVTVSNGGGVAATISNVVFSTGFRRATDGTSGTCPTAASFQVVGGSSCTIGVVFAPQTAGAFNGSLTMSTTDAFHPTLTVTLTGTGVNAPVASVTPTSLNFGNQAISTTSASQTLTLRNTGAAALTGITVTVTAPFSRPTGTTGGTCGASLAAGSPATPSTCTINIVFAPTALGTANGTATIAASATVTGSPVSLTGVGVLPVLDNFNRANATTLNNGNFWSQIAIGGVAAIQVNSNQAFCSNVPINPLFPALTPCVAGGQSYWNVGGVVSAGFGARQAAAFTFSNTTMNGASLVLKATGAILGSPAAPMNYIRVQYNATTAQVTVATTINGGGNFTSAGTLAVAGGFAVGDRLTVSVDQTGLVTVRKNVTTVAGTVQLPNNALWTSGGGRIGMQLPNGARVDDFGGANLP
jgi:hypothetical protein